MTNNRKLLMVLILSGIVSVVSCVSTTSSSKPKTEKVTSNKLGHVLPGYFFSIDAEYEPKLNNLITGYTAITVAVANKGLIPIEFRLDKDRWQVKDRNKKWHRAIIDIQYEVPQQWAQLHPETRRMIIYPVTVPPGYTQTFQLFFPGNNLDLAGFLVLKHFNDGESETFTFTRY